MAPVEFLRRDVLKLVVTISEAALITSVLPSISQETQAQKALPPIPEAIPERSTIYVKKCDQYKEGYDPDGSQEKPFISIQRALEQARPGDIVEIGHGLYDDADEYRFGVEREENDERQLTIRAAEGETVVITGTDHRGPRVDMGDYTTLQGLCIGGRRFPPPSDVRGMLWGYYGKLRSENLNIPSNLSMEKIWDLFYRRYESGQMAAWERDTYQYVGQFITEYGGVINRESVAQAPDLCGFFMGGSPIGTKKALVECNIFGYNGGVSGGSEEEYILMNNGFYNMGAGRFAHPWYLSGGYLKGSIANRIVFINNRVIGGSGWGIHGWHRVRSMIIAGNFVSGMRWGIVMGQHDTTADGIPGTSDNIVANNFVWRTKGAGSFGDEGAIGMWLDGARMVAVNNIFGPDAPIMSSGCDNPNITAPRLNAFIGRNALCEGDITIHLDQMQTQMGISAEELDRAVDCLSKIYEDPSSIMANDAQRKQLEQMLQFDTWPQESNLHNGSYSWMQPVCPKWNDDPYWWDQSQDGVPFGPAYTAGLSGKDPWEVYNAMFEAFFRLGLDAYDAYAQKIPKDQLDCFRVFSPLIK